MPKNRITVFWLPEDTFEPPQIVHPKFRPQKSDAPAAVCGCTLASFRIVLFHITISGYVEAYKSVAPPHHSLVLWPETVPEATFFAVAVQLPPGVAETKYSAQKAPLRLCGFGGGVEFPTFSVSGCRFYYGFGGFRLPGTSTCKFWTKVLWGPNPCEDVANTTTRNDNM